MQANDTMGLLRTGLAMPQLIHVQPTYMYSKHIMYTMYVHALACTCTYMYMLTSRHQYNEKRIIMRENGLRVGAGSAHAIN